MIYRYIFFYRYKNNNYFFIIIIKDFRDNYNKRIY